MRRSSILCAVAVAALYFVPSAMFASIVFLDDFNKANQPLLGTSPNSTIGGTWTITGTSTVNPIQISGNQVALTTTGQDAFAALSTGVPDAGGFAIHTSADINVSSAQATGDYFLHLSDPAGTTSFFFQRLGAVATTGGYFLNLAVTGGGGAATTPGTTVLNLNQTYHVDINWNFVAGAANDTFQVLVDNVPYITKTWDSTNGEPTGLSAVNFRQGTATLAPTVTVDNLTVEFVPEPTSLVLLALGAILGVANRRAR